MRIRRDEDEFIALLNSCRGTIFKICLQYTDRSPGAIEDLFQEIACNLWAGYGQFNHSSSVNTWVYKVARNTALMQQRHAIRQPMFVSLDESLYETVAEQGDDECRKRLYALLERLPKEEQELMDMYLENIPQEEIAQQLGISKLAVNKRVSRIKQKLKKMNDEEQE